MSAKMWDWVYFIMCLAGEIGIPLVFKVDPVKTAVALFCCSLVKEFADQVSVWTQWKWMFTLGADARGWMIMDNVRALLGCVIGLVVLFIIGLYQL